MNNKIMKKILRIFVIGLLFFSNVNAEERSNKLDKLFIQLKNGRDSSQAQYVSFNRKISGIL